MSAAFHTLIVSDKIQETKDTVTLAFNIPTTLKEIFQFQAGQYLTLKFDINGVEARRAYSMSSSPLESKIAITIKRVKGGLVSNYIHDLVKVGDSIEIMPPTGKFTPNILPEHRKTYYLIGAGSGITPLMSILKTILEEEPQSTLFLYYGSRNEQQIIFKNELDTLEQKFKGQLFVTHIISQPTRSSSGGLKGIFGKKKITWQGEKGRIDRRNIAIYLEKNIPPYPDTEYFLCGPEDMINGVQEVLVARGTPSKSIHFELFHTTADSSSLPKGEVLNGDAKAIVQLDGKTFEVNIPKNKTILDALLSIKKDPPFSCKSGSCSTCIAKVTKGSVSMNVHHGLDDEEIAEGFILSCQARPATAEIEVDFDV